jgi:hypothetical protein
VKGEARSPAWPARYAERALAWLIAWPVLRLALGRFPNPSELHRFQRSFVDRPATMPALLRGLSTIPAVRKHFQDALTPGLPGRPALLFLHIEKTAGTSVINYLRTLIPEDEIDPDPFVGAAGHILSPVPAEKCRYGLIWGHQDLPALLRCEPPRRLVLTFLRDPRERILSLYNFWHALRPEEQDGEAHSGLAAARSRSLLQFLQSPEPDVRDFIDNVYARRLTGLYSSHAEAGDQVVTQDMLRDRAIQALNRVDFVGIAERMAVSLKMLAVQLGAPPPAFIPRENALGIMQLDRDGAFKRKPAAKPGKAEHACLDELTTIDQHIYKAALEKHAKQKT